MGRQAVRERAHRMLTDTKMQVTAGVAPTAGCRAL